MALDNPILILGNIEGEDFRLRVSRETHDGVRKLAKMVDKPIRETYTSIMQLYFSEQVNKNY